MSNHEIKIPLEEEKGSEEERSTEEERIGEIAIRVVPVEVAAELAQEAAQYANQSAHVDERIAAELRVERLETNGVRGTAPDISPANRPPDRVLSRTRAQIGLRRSLRAVPEGQRKLLDGIAGGLGDLWESQGAPPSRARAEREAEPFGSSVDEFWHEIRLRNDRLRTPDDARALAEALANAHISADDIAADLARWRAALTRGDADIEAVLDAAGQILKDLRTMYDALKSLVAPAEDYVVGLLGVTRGIEQTLRLLGQGGAVVWTTTANRCVDAARWTATLGAEPTALRRDEATTTRQSRDRTQARVDTAVADIASDQHNLDTLTAEDDQLRQERPTASEARQAEIDAKLGANDTEETRLTKKIQAAQDDVTRERQRVAKLDEDLRRALADANATAAEVGERREQLRRESAGATPWSDAVAAAETAATALPAEAGGPLRERLQGVARDLDSTFFSLREAIVTSPDLEAVAARAWAFAHTIAATQALVRGMTAPARGPGAAFASARRTMQLTLAAMASAMEAHLRTRALVRGS